MKLTILFIVMQLLTLQVIRGNDLWQDQQKEEVDQQEQQQQEAVALDQEVAHPWHTPCMQQCFKDMILTTDRSAKCQRYEREFDCSMHCVLEMPLY